MKTEELVNALVVDLPTAQPRFPRILALSLALGSAIAALLFFAVIGLRPDLAAALSGARVWFKFAFALTLGVASLVLAKRVNEPGVGIGRWGYALLAAPAVLAIGVALECFLTPAAEWGARLVGVNAKYCLALIPLLAAAPLASLLLAMRQGAPSSPGWAGALAGLLAGAIAAGLYATHCPDDSPLFLATWYPLAIAIVTMLGAAIGARVLKW